MSANSVAQRARANIAELHDEVGDSGLVGRTQPHGEQHGDPAQRGLVHEEHRLNRVTRRHRHAHDRSSADGDAEQRRGEQRRQAIMPRSASGRGVLPPDEGHHADSQSQRRAIANHDLGREGSRVRDDHRSQLDARAGPPTRRRDEQVDQRSAMKVRQSGVEVPEEPGEPGRREQPACPASPRQRERAGTEEGQPHDEIGNPVPEVAPLKLCPLREDADRDPDTDQDRSGETTGVSG